MNTLAVLLAATIVAGEPKHHLASAHIDTKASQHAQEQERKQYEQAVHRQMDAEKQLEHAQERSVHEQIKAQIQAYQHPIGTQLSRPHGLGYAGRPYSSFGRSYHGGYHHTYHHRGSHYRHHQTWPMAQDPELAGLHALQQSLDHVHRGQAASPESRVAIEHALMRVVEVSRPPSVASVNRLASHLTTALADRGSPEIDTQGLALALRGGLNAPHLLNAERTEVIVQLEKALEHGRVLPTQVTAVVAALKNVEHQEIAHR